MTRARRLLGASLGALMAAAGLSVVFAADAGAATSVATEAELRAALADPATTDVVLASSIDLTDCTPGGGDLDRAGDLTLDGAGFTLRQTCAGERVLESTSGTLTLTDVTITGGDQSGSGEQFGGGVRAAGHVTIDGSTITGNHVQTTEQFAAGGGIASDGTVTATDAHVDGNGVVAGNSGWGGGIYAGALLDVTLTDSTVDSNSVTCSGPDDDLVLCGGGGVADTQTSTVSSTATDGTVKLVRTSVSSNEIHATGSSQTWSLGGGVWASSLDATDSHVDANQTSLTAGEVTNLIGAGIAADDAVIARSSIDRNVGTSEGGQSSGALGGGLNINGGTVSDSSVSHNHLTADTGEGFAAAGGVSAGSLGLDGSTITGNVVEATHQANGGGASVFTTVAITGSTISGNTASASADDGTARAAGLEAGAGDISSSTVDDNVASAPAFAQAGGLLHIVNGAVDGGPPVLTITNSTVVANRASSEAQPSVGGGIGEATSGSVTLRFATVAANEAASGANIGAANAAAPVTSLATVVSDPQGGGTNCGGLTVTDQGYTHVTDASCGTTAAPDPQLGALADNGGPTQTMLPAATSPLLDRVPDDTCTTTVTTDERGITRPQGSACDIGAVEVEVAPPDPDPPLTPPETPTTPAATAATAPTAIVAEPRFTG